MTLLVGENSAGKSNVIDALRLATMLLSGRRTRYFEVDDRSCHRDGLISLTAIFARLSRFQRAQYLGVLGMASGRANLTTRYYLLDGKHVRGRVE